MGDIGEPLRKITLVPMPDSEPLPEEVPSTPTPVKEPVPA